MSLESFFGKGPNKDTEEEEEEEEEQPKKKVAFKRHYQESYLKHGFIAKGESHAPNPLCVPLAAHFSDKEWVLIHIYSTCLMNSICHFRGK